MRGRHFPFNFEEPVNGYHTIVRGTGVIDTYRVDAGVATSIGSLATAAPTPGTTVMTIRHPITPTTITVTRVDTAHSGAVINTSAYRGRFVHLDRFGVSGPLQNRQR
jgi:hypothetical protein